MSSRHRSPPRDFLTPLVIHSDDRGSVRETYRSSWVPEVPPILQLVRSQSRPGVLRAMHAHKSQWDVWQVIEGSMTVALYDHRDGFSQVLPLTNKNTLYIGPGLSHGFYTEEGCVLLYALTRLYDGTDEYEWNAYDLPNHPWPAPESVIRSDRDKLAPSLEDFIARW